MARASNLNRRRFAMLCLSSATALGVALEVPAAAQDASAAATEDTETAEAIVVTGSRIVTRDNTSNTPIVTMSDKAIENTGGATLDGKLQQNLPQLSGSAASQFGAQGFSSGAATLNLRNLGDNRNLILLDGHRLQPSTSSFAIDINTIPAIAIQNVEVISGGASAVYGSDAMSGVVNFRLKRNARGLQVDAQYQGTEHGGANSTSVSALFGAEFADGRGNIMIAADYTYRAGLLNSQRDFYRRAAAAGSQAVGGSQFLDFGYYVPGGNAPSQAALDTYFGTFGAPAGSVTGANGFGIPSTNIGFNNDLSLFNVAGANIYNFKGDVTNGYNAITSNPFGKSVVQANQYRLYSGVPLERVSLFTTAEYDLTEHISAFIQGSFNSYQSKTSSPAGSAANFWSRTIAYDANHPVPAALATLLDSRTDPTAPFTIGSSTTFAGNALYTHDNDVYQILVGLKGDVGLSDWTWEISGSHGRTQIVDRQATGAVSFARLNEVQTAANYGAGVCAGGISPFGQLNPAVSTGPLPGSNGNNPSPLASQIVSASCLDYVTVRPINRTQQKQDVAELNLQGKIVALPAGDLRFAAGASYRRNSYEFSPDNSYRPIASLGGASDVIGLFGQLPTAGEVNVKEVYGELLAPILRDQPFVQSLSIDAAYRYSDYNTSGGVSAYKVDGDWQVNDILRFRAGYQRAVRAPNVVELFGAAQQIFQFNSFDPCSVQTPDQYANNPGNPSRAAVRNLCAALTPGSTPSDFNTFVGTIPIQIGQLTGNPNLKPETANTVTAGLVLTPRIGATKVSLSVDFYRIKIEAAINNVGPGDQMGLCFNSLGGNPTYSPTSPLCAPLARAPIAFGGYPTTTSVSFQNQGGISTQGVDAQLNVSSPIGSGNFGLNVLVNYLDSFERQLAPGFPTLDYAGTNGGYFRWKTFTTLSYGWDGIDAGLRYRFFSAVAAAPLSAAGTPGNKAYHAVDIYANYQLTKSIKLRAGVDNLLDREPPVVGGLLGNTEPSNYDILGRRFTVGISSKF